MQTIKEAKAAQIPEFQQRLIETKGSFLVEATTDLFWASGLSPEETGKIDPKFYPGKNQLGSLLMEIRDVLLCVTEDLHEDDALSSKNAECTVFSVNSDQTSLASLPSESAATSQTVQVVKPKMPSSGDQQKVSSQIQPKQSVMTNIKGILTQQKEKSKRKSSKTPEKEKGSKIQKQQKAVK